MLSEASPTGHAVTDTCLLGIATAVVVFAAASAPWWMLVVSSLSAAIVAGTPLLSSVAAIGGLLGLLIGWRRRDLALLRGASAAITMIVLGRAEIETSFGVTAAVAIAVGTALTIGGLRRRPRRVRRMAWAAGAGVLVLGIVAVGAFMFEAMAARSALADGKREAQAAIDAVERGDYELAAAHFELATNHLTEADSHLDRPWTWPASLLPVVAQHRAAAVDLAGTARGAMSAAGDAVSAIDPNELRVQNGVIDLNAVRALTAPIDALNDAMDDLSSTIADADSPWLVAPLQRELDELSAELSGGESQLDNVTSAVELAPQMLGANGPRVYLVLFTTPSESRGLGGFVGNYAELTLDEGRVSMTDFGRVRDLELRGREVGVRISGPAQFLVRYGTFGYNDDGHGLVGTAPWRNLTVSPNFPDVAAVAAEMYPQITGQEIDGVISVDPFVVAALLGYTGPISLETVDVTIDASNAAQYLLVDQYAITDTNNLDRIDALDEVARRTVELLLAGAMPGPDALARDLGPLAVERRVTVWTEDASEQELLRRVDLLGEIPSLDGADGWAVTVSNAAGNKIDTFLARSFEYRSTTTDGVTSSTLTAVLTNTAPSEGMTDYIIGNGLGLAPGTSRLYVSFYSALPLRTATINGNPISPSMSSESGWFVYSTFVTISSGSQATFELAFTGSVANPGQVVTWEQPLVIPADVTSEFVVTPVDD